MEKGEEFAAKHYSTAELTELANHLAWNVGVDDLKDAFPAIAKRVAELGIEVRGKELGDRPPDRKIPEEHIELFNQFESGSGSDVNE